MTARPPLPEQPAGEPNGWFERYVTYRFDDLAQQLECLDKKLDAVRQTVPRIDERTRITAMLFGVLGGFLPAVAGLIYLVIKGHP